MAKLKRYRAEQALIAAERDNYTCRVCGRPAEDRPHHIHGRAATWDELGLTHEKYERADVQICLCRACHNRCHHTTPRLTPEELLGILEKS